MNVFVRMALQFDQWSFSRREGYREDWVPKSLDTSWKVPETTNGWSSNDGCLKSSRECSERQTRNNPHSDFRLLICGRHGGYKHSSLPHAIEHKIILFCPVGHSSHLTQPFDSSIFGPLKRRPNGQNSKLWHRGRTKFFQVRVASGFLSYTKRIYNLKNYPTRLSSDPHSSTSTEYSFKTSRKGCFNNGSLYFYR